MKKKMKELLRERGFQAAMAVSFLGMALGFPFYQTELKEQGKTIILASHNSEYIRILCDKVYEMDEGKLSHKI